MYVIGYNKRKVDSGKTDNQIIKNYENQEEARIWIIRASTSLIVEGDEIQFCIEEPPF